MVLDKLKEWQDTGVCVHVCVRARVCARLLMVLLGKLKEFQETDSGLVVGFLTDR